MQLRFTAQRSDLTVHNKSSITEQGPPRSDASLNSIHQDGHYDSCEYHLRTDKVVIEKSIVTHPAKNT